MVNLQGYLLPPKKMLCMTFLRKVLDGRKKLLIVKNTQAIPIIPRFAEINVSKLWKEIKVDQSFQLYFSDSFIDGERIPDRTYFFTVM